MPFAGLLEKHREVLETKDETPVLTKKLKRRQERGNHGLSNQFWNRLLLNKTVLRTTHACMVCLSREEAHVCKKKPCYYCKRDNHHVSLCYFATTKTPKGITFDATLRTIQKEGRDEAPVAIIRASEMMMPQDQLRDERKAKKEANGKDDEHDDDVELWFDVCRPECSGIATATDIPTPTILNSSIIFIIKFLSRPRWSPRI